MKKVIIVGGGFAGLSAAVFLSNKNYQVELIEASPKLGGRAYSYYDNSLNDVVDNAQHIMMGCYNETLNFIKLINAEKNLIFQDRLEIAFVNKEKRLIPLSSTLLPYPLGLLLGLLQYDALSFANRIKVILFMVKVYFTNEESLGDKSIESWLKENGQTGNINKALWEIIVVGALNTTPAKASAKIFVKILKQIFFKGNFSSTIILPKTGLSEMYCEPSKQFIESKNGKINLSEQVTQLQVSNNKITTVITDKRKISEFDYVIFTIPPYALKRINGIEAILDNTSADLEYSSILTFHIRLKDNPLEKNFYGLIGSPLHWVFNHGKYITTVISDADDLIDKSKEELFELVWKEIEKYFGLQRDTVQNYQILKEKRATFIPNESALKNRPSTKTKLENIFLAGDWIETGLPATIESAVISGKMASDLLIKTDN
jgi:squalene-associated FAD-dependent desaturase